ncbi:hypothetical protein AB0J83_12275 [Actinoplanes sp. NPDC049596]|uniref:hypothetical protein n=1 Tax=unclassified Actinoplanes TaxID=2626549 RepID=UPI00342757F0
MTRTTDPPPLADALGIPGASAVSLLDPDGPRVLWWAGGGPPDEQQAATVVTLAAAAAGMVMLGETGDELGDVLLTSSDAFHVVRLVEDGTSPLVAHLTLRRAGANLAMARREFGSLIKAYAGQVDETRKAAAPVLAPSPAPAIAAAQVAPDLTADPEVAAFVAAEPEVAAFVTAEPAFGAAKPAFGAAEPEPAFVVADPEVAAFESGYTSSAPVSAPPVPVPPPGELPRRNRVEPAETGSPDEGSAPDLFSLLGRPYTADDDILDRVLGALRLL